jgi:hypothetical protein
MYESLLNPKTLFSFFTGFGNLPKKITKSIHTRRYRLLKKNPKTFKQVTIYDMGNVEQSTHLSFKTEKLQKVDLELSKDKNPDLETIRIGEIKLAFYLNSEKGFIYDKLGFFSGTFLKHDLINAYSQIGSLLNKIKRSKGYYITGDMGGKSKK